MAVDFKSYSTCAYHEQGHDVLDALGNPMIWQTCDKNWGKPAMIGVIKDVCNNWKLK